MFDLILGDDKQDPDPICKILMGRIRIRPKMDRTVKIRIDFIELNPVHFVKQRYGSGFSRRKDWIAFEESLGSMKFRIVRALTDDLEEMKGISVENAFVAEKVRK